MNDYLIFDTQAAADTALETIYANMIGEIDSPDLLDVATGQVVDKDSLTPEQAVQTDSSSRHFPIFGVNAATGVKSETAGYTTAWAVAQETVDSKWVFQKPADALMVGVTGYTVEPYDPDWFPQPAELTPA